ncbi:MAG: hypothetical protein PUF03_06855 [Lachnospiraceae bacterium]|nr:hypothetical protein [Lachnospiraceae bacterium]
MFYEFVIINFAPLAGLLFLFIFLVSNKKSDQEKRRIFLGLCFLEIIELVAYSMELWTASFDHPTTLRILLSAIGYSIRPLLLLGILQMFLRLKITDKKFLLWAVPALLNILAAFSAFFTDIMYSYDASNEFVRGTLGYITHIVSIFYLLSILILSFFRFSKGHLMENAVIWGISVVVLTAIVLESVFRVKGICRAAFVLSTIAYYLYFQTLSYREEISTYMEQTIASQKEHLREMNIIGVLANEYVTVCYVDVEKNVVTPYRMDPFIEKNYGEKLHSGVSFEQIFRAYVSQNIYEEDQEFFLNLADVQVMLDYLRENGSLSRKYRVRRNGAILYCEMRVELVTTEDGVEDMVFGFSNNDNRVRREMVYQSAVQQEIDKVAETKNSLAGIAALARQLQEEIEDKLLHI